MAHDDDDDDRDDEDEDDDDEEEVESKKPAPKPAAKPAAKPAVKPSAKPVAKAPPVDENIALLREIRDSLQDLQSRTLIMPLVVIVLLAAIAIFSALRL